MRQCHPGKAPTDRRYDGRVLHGRVVAAGVGVACGVVAVWFEPGGAALLVVAGMYCALRAPRESAHLIGLAVLAAALVFAPSAVFAATERLCFQPIGIMGSGSRLPCISHGGPDLYGVAGEGLLLLSAGWLMVRGRRATLA